MKLAVIICGQARTLNRFFTPFELSNEYLNI